MAMFLEDEYHFCILCGGPFKRSHRIKAFLGEEIVLPLPRRDNIEVERDPETIESYLNPVDGRNVRSGEMDWLVDVRVLYPVSEWATLSASLHPQENNREWYFLSGVGYEYGGSFNIFVPPHESIDQSTPETPSLVELDNSGSGGQGTSASYIPMHDACWNLLELAMSTNNDRSDQSLSAVEATLERVARHLFKMLSLQSHEYNSLNLDSYGPFSHNEDLGWNVWRYTWGEERFIYLPRIEYVLCDPCDDKTMASYLSENAPKLGDSEEVDSQVTRLVLSSESPRSKTPFDKLPFEIMTEIANLLSIKDVLNLNLSARAIHEYLNTRSQTFWRSRVLNDIPLLSPNCKRILTEQENIDWRTLYDQLNKPLKNTAKEEHNKLVKSVYDEENDYIDEEDDDLREELEDLRGMITAEDLGDPEWKFTQPEEAHCVLGWRNRRRIFKTCQQIVKDACDVAASHVLAKENMPPASRLRKAVTVAPAEAYYPNHIWVTRVIGGQECSSRRPEVRRTDGPDPRDTQKLFFKYTPSLESTVYLAPPCKDVEFQLEQPMDDNLKYVVTGMRITDKATSETAILGTETDDSYHFSLQGGIRSWIVTFNTVNKNRIACIQVMRSDGTISPIPDTKFRHPAHLENPYFYPGIKQEVRAYNAKDQVGIVANFSRTTEQKFMNFFGVLELPLDEGRRDCADLKTGILRKPSYEAVIDAIPLRQRYKFIDTIPPEDVVCHILTDLDIYSGYSLDGRNGDGVHLVLFPQFYTDGTTSNEPVKREADSKWSKCFEELGKGEEIVSIEIALPRTEGLDAERWVDTWAVLKTRSGRRLEKVTLTHVERESTCDPLRTYLLEAPVGEELVGFMYDEGVGFGIVTRLRGEYRYDARTLLKATPRQFTASDMDFV